MLLFLLSVPLTPRPSSALRRQPQHSCALASPSTPSHHSPAPPPSPPSWPLLLASAAVASAAFLTPFLRKPAPASAVQLNPSAPVSNPPAPSKSAYHASLPDWTSASPAPRRTTAATLARAAPRRPATVGLVSVGAVSTSVVLRRLRHRTRLALERSDIEQTSRLHNVSTVVCIQIPFCSNDRHHLIQNLQSLLATQSCATPAAAARACRAAAAVLVAETGVLEDSRRFAPRVDLFLAEDVKEAERRFSAHVTIEAARLDRLQQRGLDAIAAQHPVYGVVTMVVATAQGVDLGCYHDGLTNLQILRSALDAMRRVNEGDIAGLELLWVPETPHGKRLTRAQIADNFPSLRIL